MPGYAEPKGIASGRRLASGAVPMAIYRILEAGIPLPALRNPEHLAKEAAHSATGASRALFFRFRPRATPVKGISLPWRVS
ncbi:hypothetical protein [Mesorhizobium sp.]|uniref:hypothetical protein n=1 Tax=Mesorhizobium sp. TaxID=1871066 RepID=UPI000FE53143|nr:hypothetical protein [Mesorhizobium sp.]RWE45266.1 MAG: hypothetical protein EOS80_16485 [Mesorhizobium sp.]